MVVLCVGGGTWSNESTTGADASVEALKLYHMKLTVKSSSLLALLAIVIAY